MNGDTSIAKRRRKECKEQEAGSTIIELSLTLLLYEVHLGRGKARKKNENRNRKFMCLNCCYYCHHGDGGENMAGDALLGVHM
eukprot:4935211-Ditylum_brightwellii.AAC.1